MKKINEIRIMSALVAALTLNCMTTESSAITLPDPLSGINSYQYGDFYSYSLPILAYHYDQIYGGGVGPGNPYYVSSTSIGNTIVVATKSEEVNFSGMDNAYQTPNGGGSTFYTGTTSDPGQVSTFSGDQANTWDTRIEAFKSYLGTGNAPIFLFNNNQTGNEQDLYAWARVTISSSTDSSLNPILLEMANNHGFGPLPGGFSIPYASNGSEPLPYDYVHSGGKVCTDVTATAVVSCDSPGAITFNHNLGANQAAYALISPELNTFLTDWNSTSLYDLISIDLRMTGLNNGYEQVFILPGTVTAPPVPEPGTLVLFGAGLLGLGIYTKRRMKK